MPAPPDLTALLDSIRAAPGAAPGWLALAAHLRDRGLTDDATVVRAFWPTLRDSLAGGWPLETTLQVIHQHAGRWGRQARKAGGH